MHSNVAASSHLFCMAWGNACFMWLSDVPGVPCLHFYTQASHHVVCHPPHSNLLHEVMTWCCCFPVASDPLPATALPTYYVFQPTLAIWITPFTSPVSCPPCLGMGGLYFWQELQHHSICTQCTLHINILLLLFHHISLHHHQYYSPTNITSTGMIQNYKNTCDECNWNA